MAGKTDYQDLKKRTGELEKELVLLRGQEVEQREKLEFLERMVDFCPTGLVLTDTRGRVVAANQQAKNIFGLTRARIARQGVKGTDTDLTTELSKVFQELDLPYQVIVKTRTAVYSIERSLDTLEGQRIFLTINSAPFPGEDGQITGILSTLEDTTDTKLAEEDREKLVGELSNQSRQLAELNTALRALVTGREKDKDELEEQIMANLNNAVFPYLEKLDHSRLSEEQRVFLEIAFSNLTRIFSSFGSNLAARFARFTPRELQVATLIRQGRMNKDIAEILNLSVRSVESHRRSIRKKIGLTGEKVNLRTYLASLK